jgi:basic amino acid/polyamine antiporter, APA family
VTTPRPLLRILGLGFGLALAFGSTIGVGILRLPGLVAATLGDRALIIGVWVLGGLYALMGAVAVAELAAMHPETGGFRVYARHAFGEQAGFTIGWCDWLCGVVALAYSTIAAVTFPGRFWPAAMATPRASAVAVIGGFFALHWMSLRLGSSLTAIISVSIGLMLVALVVGCFLVAPTGWASTAPRTGAVVSLPWNSMAMVLAVVPAVRAVLTAYDGWYTPIYMAEENTDPVRTLPRAVIGGTLLIVGLYLLINLAYLRVLSLPALAASALPAADAARVLWPRGGAELVTILSLVTMISLLNNLMLYMPRILYALGRDGLFTGQAATVSDGGTPRTALTVTAGTVVLVILSGTFEQIIALFAVLFLFCYLSAFAAVFVLRYRDPARARPYKAFLYPWSTAIVLLGTVAFLVATVVEDPRSGLVGAVFVAACVPAYAWVARRRRLRIAIATF